MQRLLVVRSICTDGSWHRTRAKITQPCTNEQVVRRGGMEGWSREYCMIYRGPGFHAVVWFGSSPTPLSRQQLTLFLRLPVCRWSCLLTGERGAGKGLGRKKFIRPRESWFSINHSILSGMEYACIVYCVTYTKLHGRESEGKDIGRGPLIFTVVYFRSFPPPPLYRQLWQPCSTRDTEKKKSKIEKRLRVTLTVKVEAGEDGGPK